MAGVPAHIWRLKTRTLELPRRPLLMGILNVTPDSFSDGGLYRDVEAACDRARQLVEDGADIIDIGGESTRPYAEPVVEHDELERVMPVIERLAGSLEVPISIDTRKAAVAKAAIAVGAEIINDVSGMQGDPAMVDVALTTGTGLCVMHMQGTPQTMQVNPTYGDVVSEVHDYLRSRRDSLIAAGVDPERICLDPGLGFGKSAEHNLFLMRHCRELHELGCPILVGPSRKGFLAALVGDRQVDRTAATVEAALILAAQQVQILRVHDVRQVRQALVTYEASGGLDPGF